MMMMIFKYKYLQDYHCCKLLFILLYQRIAQQLYKTIYLLPMQIDRHNFHQHKDLILQQIQQAHFIAFDCEFTGLVTQSNNIQGIFPNQQEFYQRIKETALNFNLLQLGLTLFHFENGQYYPRSYNFYVSASHKPGHSQIILSEWESMAFLAKNGMDFNRVFKDGITFRRIFDEQVKQHIQNKLGNQTEQQIFFSPKDKQTIQKIQQNINKGALKINFTSKKILDFFKNIYDMSLDKPKKDMDRFEYVIKIYQSIKMEDNNQKTKVDPEDLVLCTKKEEISFQEKPHVNVGLQILIQKIIDCKKPIVGHFPNLDLGLIYHSFIAKLPQHYPEFSDKINELFPYIFDTKVISRRLQSKLKSIKVDLKSLYRACFNKKLLQQHANINYKYVQNYIKQESSHEAGYDSFMTGCAFIAMLNFLYNVKHQFFVFANAYPENKILYSRFSGEVSLVGPIYNQRAEQFKRKIIIYSGSRQKKIHLQMGQQLSKLGTLTMHENHGQIYYYFQQEQDISSIVNEYKNLKRYEDRFILKCANFFK